MRQSRTALEDFLRGATLVALALAAAPLSAQEVYKSVDAQGNVVYSDRGSTKNAPATTLHVTEPDPAEVARLAKQQQLLGAEERQRQKQDAIDSHNKAVGDHNKQVACENARNKYYRYKDAGRIYQRDADGNRIYYSDEQSDQLREQSRRAMLAACGSSAP